MDDARIIAWLGLTEKQRRRVRLYMDPRYNIQKIAEMEGVTRSAIWQSLYRSFKVLPALEAMSYDFLPV